LTGDHKSEYERNPRKRRGLTNQRPQSDLRKVDRMLRRAAGA
jgi:hypothetical protein